MNQEILRMEQIMVTAAGGTILNNAWINCFRGELVGLLGLNDSGKSCMMRVLTGACPEYTGKIWIEEQPVRISSVSDARRYGIFLIKRSLSLIPEMSVAENIFLVHPKNYSPFISRKRQNIQAGEILSRFQVGVSEKQSAGSLTYYQKFLVEICKVAIQSPKIIIIDGILSRFSSSEINHVESIFRRMTDSGVSILLVDHHLMPATMLCNRIFVFRRGRNAGYLTKKHIRKSTVFSQMIGSPAQPLNMEKIPVYPARTSSSRLEFRHVCINSVWNDVSFHVSSGEVLGLINIDDPDGFIWRKLFLGATIPDGGCIRANGKCLVPFSKRSSWSKAVGLVMEPFYLFPALSLWENIILPAMSRTSHALGVLDQSQLRYLAGELSTDYLSDEDFENPIFQNRKTNRLLEREINLCKILSGNPDYLILVNPTLNLDAPSKQRIDDDIISVRQRGKGILLQSTSIDDLATLCDRLIIIQNARLAECPLKAGNRNFIEEYGRYLSEI